MKYINRNLKSTVQTFTANRILMNETMSQVILINKRKKGTVKSPFGQGIIKNCKKSFGI
jgi:hypothetical protein